MHHARAARSWELRWLSTTGAVLAIAAASLVGLHDWADGVSTHDVATSVATGQDPAAG
jgi:hypothetical protein